MKWLLRSTWSRTWAKSVNRHSLQISLILQNLLFFIPNVILCNLKYLLNILWKELMEYWKFICTRIFFFTSQCAVVGQLLMHVKIGSVCPFPPGSLALGYIGSKRCESLLSLKHVNIDIKTIITQIVINNTRSIDNTCI